MRQNRPLVRYLVSSPYGDITADENKWDLPLEGDELKTHYKAYFHSIKDFLSQDEFKLFLSSISQKLAKEVHLNKINEIIIRTEKHGFLYHPASVEVILTQNRVNPVRKSGALDPTLSGSEDGDFYSSPPQEAKLSNRVKFGLNVAISELGRYWLKEEYGVLEKLRTKFGLPYLPRVYCLRELNGMCFVLEDWFEGYHEFHIFRDKDGAQRLKLWDFDHGYKYLSSEQSFELYKQASKILTLYYDFKDYSQILHWHHAAGDFVVKIEDRVMEAGGRGLGRGGIDVRLTTARRYEPPMVFRNKDPVNPFLGLFSFFLNLTVRMRMDKLNGMGEVVWADDICLEATITGFLEALKLKEELKNYIGSVEEFLGLLKSFGEEELKITFNTIIDLYTGEEYFAVLIENLEEHVRKLYATIQNLP